MNTTYIIDASYLSPDLSVVFDGYSGKWSTKDHEHFLRWFSSEALFDESSFEAMPSDMFLATPNSNAQLVYLLLIHVNNSGVETDADTLLVLKTVSKCNIGKTTILLGEDNDLVVGYC